MPVCIAGAPRSGASLVAEVLHLAGLSLGPEPDGLPPASETWAGSWEDARFREVNEAILNELGGGWDCPPPAAADWGDGLGHLRAKALLVLAGVGDREAWGWKDPLSSLTLPFWDDLIDDLRTVVVLRNPLEVALSQHHRHGVSPALSLRLWVEYNRRILETAGPERRLVTHYDAYFHEPQAEIGRLLGFLGLPAGAETVERCRAACRADRRHHRLTTRQLLDAGVGSEVLDLYRELCAEAGWTDDGGARPTPVENGAAPAVGRSLRRAAGRFPQGALDGGGNGGAVVATAAAGTAGQAIGGIGRLNRSVVEAELLRRERDALQSELAARDATIAKLRTALTEQESAYQEQAQTWSAEWTELEELRRTVAEQAEQLEALIDGLCVAPTREVELREMLVDAQAQLARRDAEILAALGVGRRLTAPRAPTVVHAPDFVDRVRRVACAALPADATVLVASSGDAALLMLEGRQAWHFPQAADGGYAMHSLADGAAAIAHLKALRAKGATFLLVPSTAVGWIMAFAGFKRYLETTYDLIVREFETCLIFAPRGHARP